MPSSLRDVATAAGVSVATVSHVINGTRFVSPELTARVRRALADLNYYPNLVARSLRTQRTQTIGFITSDITNPLYMGVAKGASFSSAQNGYSLVLCDVGEGDMNEAEIVFWLLRRKVDGLLFTSVHADSHVIAYLNETGFPFVLINRHLHGLDTNYVGLQNEMGVAAAVHHLATLGHRRIAFIGGVASSTAAMARREGFLEGMREAGLEPDPNLFDKGDYLMEGGYMAAGRLMQAHPDVTAIVSANDLMAFGAWRWLHQNGFQVPGDVSLVGFDDIPPSSMGPVGLTTVACPQYEMGERAVEILLDCLKRKEKHVPKHAVLPVQLVVRDTTAPPRK